MVLLLEIRRDPSRDRILVRPITRASRGFDAVHNALARHLRALTDDLNYANLESIKS